MATTQNGHSCKATVIVTPTGAGNRQRECIASLTAQKFDLSRTEVIWIGRIRETETEKDLKNLEARLQRLMILEPAAGDLSAARNRAVQAAAGEYIFHLDDDTMISPDTLKNVLFFFDAHQGETELVTWHYSWILPDGTKSRPRYRDEILRETGVYDLADPANRYIDQTGMSICARNSDSPVLFRQGSRRFEDLMYIIAHLQKNSRIGYCAEAERIYAMDPEQAYDPQEWGFFSFENETSAWEKILSGKVPLTEYLQAQYIFYLDRKTSADSLLPYQQSEEQLHSARKRHAQLLNRVDDRLLLEHPALRANGRSHYFIAQKTDTEISIRRTADRIEVLDRGTVIDSEERIRLVIFRLKNEDGYLEIRGRIDSPLCCYTEDLSLLVRENGEDGPMSRAERYPSSFGESDQLGKPVTRWNFVIRREESEKTELRFFVETGGFLYPAFCEFSGFCQPFSDRLKRYIYCDRGRLLIWQDGTLRASRVKGRKERAWKRKQWQSVPESRWTKLTRKLAAVRTGYYDHIWLYYDATDVFHDNGRLQFEHDIRKRDGIRRYYILNASDPERAMEQIPEALRRHVVPFGSRFHKFLLLRAEKILESFADDAMILPFPPGVYETYRTFSTQPEMIYLQHGVLHAHLPEIYSMDRMWIDREVISTGLEYENLTKSYGFSGSQLIPSGMPRYDGMDPDRKPERRILLAPSWRRYLVHREGARVFPVMERFLASAFYQETLKFLNSPELAELLEEYDWELDFRLHRIFGVYREAFHSDCGRIHVLPEKRNEADYGVLITDFSSYEYDFVYLKRAILHFYPDEELFRGGLNHYRKTDLPDGMAFGQTAHSAEEAVKELRDILKNHGEPAEPFRGRMEDFFCSRGNDHRESLYRELMGFRGKTKPED